MNKQLSTRLQELVAGPGEDINLAEGALIIAGLEYPDLDRDRYLAALDRMGDDVRALAGADGEPLDILRAMNTYLFEHQGFCGNHEQYYDPRNSFLNDVIDRRTGIPVTLSVVYLELGWRLGLDLAGVPFPGHFLVKLAIDEGEVLLDPYSGGISLSLEDIETRLAAVGRGLDETRAAIPSLLDPASKRDILLRMASNLRAIYRSTGDWPRLLALSELLLVLAPDDAGIHLDRAACYEGLEYPAGALEAYRAYLAGSGAPADAEAIRNRMVELSRSGGAVH